MTEKQVFAEPNIKLFKEVYDFLYTDLDKEFHRPHYPLLEMGYDILRFRDAIGDLIDKEFDTGFCLQRSEENGGNQYGPLFEVYRAEYVRLDKLATKFLNEVVEPLKNIESTIRHDFYHGVY